MTDSPETTQQGPAEEGFERTLRIAAYVVYAIAGVYVVQMIAPAIIARAIQSDFALNVGGTQVLPYCGDVIFVPAWLTLLLLVGVPSAYLMLWKRWLFDLAGPQLQQRAAAPLPSKVFDWIIDISALAGAFIVMYVATAIGLNVLMRFACGAPLKWSLPTTEFSLLYLTFLAAPVVLRREGHVRMTAITERLGGRGRLWFYVAGSFLSSAVCGILTWQSFEKTWAEFQRGAVLLSGIEVPRAAVTWVIAYGFALLAIQFFRMGVNALLTRRVRERAEEAGI